MKKVISLIIVLITVLAIASSSIAVKNTLELKTKKQLIAEVERLQAELIQTKKDFETYKTNEYYNDAQSFHIDYMSAFMGISSFLSGSTYENNRIIIPGYSKMFPTNMPAYAKTTEPTFLNIVVPDGYCGLVKGYIYGQKTFQLLPYGIYRFELEGIVILFPKDKAKYYYDSYYPNFNSLEYQSYKIYPYSTPK